MTLQSPFQRVFVGTASGLGMAPKSFIDGNARSSRHFDSLKRPAQFGRQRHRPACHPIDVHVYEVALRRGYLAVVGK
jgi:hypothetical protein